MPLSPPNGVFSMFGAREICAVAGSALQIEQQISAIEKAFPDEPGLVFDLCRSMIESVCRTVLSDRGETFNLGFKDLLERTYKAIDVLPSSFTGDASLKDDIIKLHSGLEAVIFGLTNLRHKAGLASHGKVATTPSLDRAHALLAARSADALVHFIYAAHKGIVPPPPDPKLELDDNKDFNEYLDSSNEPVRISGLGYTPSEVLFSVDHQAYRDLLANFEAEGLEESTV